jgi:DNA-binding response OmpR family regulator
MKLEIDRVTVSSFLQSLPSSPSNRDLVLYALLSGRVWHVADLVDLIWGNEPEGGPLTAEEFIRKEVHCLRKAGFIIGSRYAVGYRLVGASFSFLAA